MSAPSPLSTAAIADAMLRASLDAIVAIDQDNLIVEWNPAAERMFGYSRLQALGQPLSLLIVPPRYREAHERGLSRYVATRVPHLVNHRVQLEAQRRGGEVFPCEIAFHPLEFEDRMYFAAYLRDMTDQLRADRERDQLARVAEASTDFIAFSDLDNRLMYINRAGRQLVGYDGDIPAQATLADVVYPEDREWLVREVWPQVSETGQWQGEMRFFHQGTGEAIDVHRTIFAVRDSVTGQEVGFATVSRDIREIKKAERERLTWQARLEAQVAERTRELTDLNEELDAFSYGVSHDLRAPIRQIAGFSQLARRALEDPQESRAGLYLQMTEQAAVKMDTLVEALLNLARQAREPLRLVPVDLGRTVERVRAELDAGVAQRRMRWEVGDLPVVQGDAVLLHQVLSNLLQNAVKYTRTRPLTVIAVRAYRVEAEWVVEVRDNGVGFDPVYAGKLFGVFQRLHSEKEFEGIGVGFANVQRIVKRHGGRIWASAVLDQGATFSFSLPA
ncbi:PAS domain S-box protein (plasmid) [Deinococcus radiomollis]|uniref:sensor histidine kinase n=1 Tax=Deinococcus radiomollis TaxID=468916 RepID=UPI00389255C7